MIRPLILINLLFVLICANCTTEPPVSPTATPTTTPSVTATPAEVFTIITPTPAPVDAGDALPLPITETIPPVTLPVRPSPTPTPCVPRADWTGTYTVQAGDTLFGIAQQLGISVVQLQTANCITDANLVFAGAQLRVPGE
jgi:LysM repeat protein